MPTRRRSPFRAGPLNSMLCLVFRGRGQEAGGRGQGGWGNGPFGSGETLSIRPRQTLRTLPKGGHPGEHCSRRGDRCTADEALSQLSPRATLLRLSQCRQIQISLSTLSPSDYSYSPGAVGGMGPRGLWEDINLEEGQYGRLSPRGDGHERRPQNSSSRGDTSKIIHHRGKET